MTICVPIKRIHLKQEKRVSAYSEVPTKDVYENSEKLEEQMRLAVQQVREGKTVSMSKFLTNL